MNKGNIKKALTFYEKSLSIRQQLLPPNHPDLAKFLQQHRCGVLTAWVNIRKHFRITKKHLKFRQQSLPPNHPDLASSYNNIGNWCMVWCKHG